MTMAIEVVHLKFESEPCCNIKVIVSGVGLPGGRLKKKDGLTRYGDSHVKDKTS